MSDDNSVPEPAETQYATRNTQYAQGIALVLLAATLWGTLGTIYTLTVDNYGLTPITVVFYRAFLSAGLIGLWMLLFRRSAFRVARRDWPLLLAYGLLGVTVFFISYVYSVVLVGVTTAVLLLYTAPVIVALLAWRFLGEKMTPVLVTALLLNFAGVVLVSGAYDPAAFSLNVVGIVCGLLAAATYALYSIFGKIALSRKLPLPSMMFYMFLVGSLGLLLAQPPELLLAPSERVEVWAVLLMLAGVQTLGALGAYTLSLRFLEASTASIIATFEPLVAGLLAYFVLSQPLGLPMLAGGALVLLAVLALQLPTLRLRGRRNAGIKERRAGDAPG